jgi:hypothetical protein
MENVTIKAKHSVEVESEIAIPKFFVLTKYYYYKLINKNTVLVVTNFETGKDSILSLELFPSIKVEHIRYVSWHIKPDNFEEITEEEFISIYNKTIKLISSI